MNCVVFPSWRKPNSRRQTGQDVRKQAGLKNQDWNSQRWLQYLVFSWRRRPCETFCIGSEVQVVKHLPAEQDIGRGVTLAKGRGSCWGAESYFLCVTIHVPEMRTAMQILMQSPGFICMHSLYCSPNIVPPFGETTASHKLKSKCVGGVEQGRI